MANHFSRETREKPKVCKFGLATGKPNRGEENGGGRVRSHPRGEAREMVIVLNIRLPQTWSLEDSSSQWDGSWLTLYELRG